MRELRLGVRATALATALVATAATLTWAHAQAPAPAAREQRAVPDSPPPLAITADGRIMDIVRRGDRIYVRGDFHSLGAFTGSGMPLDPTSGQRVPAPEIDGQISVSVADGVGGWFIGGDFRHVGEMAADGLAHLGPDGVPDANFAPEVNGLISALDLHDGTLWIGGNFSRVDGIARKGLASVSADTGEVLLAFDSPKQGRVTELAYAEASGGRSARIYVATDRVVALDPTSGAADTSFNSSLSGKVRALLVDGDSVYVGGPGLAALDADSGNLDPSFDAAPGGFNSQFEGTVHTLVSDGGRIFAGGDFATLGGVHGPLVSLDPTTGLGDSSFTPAISRLTYYSNDRGVFDLAMAGGDLWVGGSFAQVGGTPAGNLVALDPATGARRAVTPPTYDRQVNAVEVSGGKLYIGGQFFMADAARAGGFAALDAETLLPVPGFDPARNGYGSMIPGRDAIYLAYTMFEGYDPSAYARRTKKFFRRNVSGVRAVDQQTGASLNKLRVSHVENLTGVTTIGNELFVARRLDNDVRFPRNRVSVYSQSSGALKRTFLLPLPGYVTELSSLGPNLIVAGSFRRHRANGQPAHLAALEVDVSKGGLRSAFDLHTHGPVYDISRQGADLYVAGMFDSVRSGTARVARPGIAKFSRNEAGSVELERRFQPPAFLANRRIYSVLGLGDSVLIDAYGSVFLDGDTATRLPDAADGYAGAVDAAVPDPDGIVYSATIYVRLAGNASYPLSFISRGDSS